MYFGCRESNIIARKTCNLQLSRYIVSTMVRRSFTLVVLQAYIFPGVGSLASLNFRVRTIYEVTII